MKQETSGIDSYTLSSFVKRGISAQEHCKDGMPSLDEIVAFLQAYREFTAHGYFRILEDGKRRFIIEGVEGGPLTLGAIAAFAFLFNGADEFDTRDGYCYCWYD